MIGLRRSHPSLRRQQFFSGALSHHGLPDVSWHGCRLGEPGFGDPNSRVLALTLTGLSVAEPDLHIVFNSESADLDFEVPAISGQQWRRFADTALPSPLDISDTLDGGEPVNGPFVRVQAHSTVVLVSSIA
jgi:glycogen operon protein